VAAKAYDVTGESAWESMPPPGVGDDGTHDTGVGPLDRLTRPVANAIFALEQALDFDDGWSAVRETSTLMEHEKDVELVERWAGIDPVDVAHYAPHLGSPRAVEYARRRLGLRAKSGLPLE
jgi:hypothetical protein